MYFCEYCGKEFKSVFSLSSHKSHCIEYNKIRGKKLCKVCGRPLRIESDVYCSTNCWDKDGRNENLEPNSRKVAKLGGSSNKNRKYLKTREERIRTLFKRERVRDKDEFSNLFLDGKLICELCGFKSVNKYSGKVQLEFHHILGKKNSEDNIILLCPNCHAKTPSFKYRKCSSRDINYENLDWIIENLQNIKRFKGLVEYAITEKEKYGKKFCSNSNVIKKSKTGEKIGRSLKEFFSRKLTSEYSDVKNIKGKDVSLKQLCETGLKSFREKEYFLEYLGLPIACEICGCSDKNKYSNFPVFSIHHVLTKENDYRNMIVLCENCHSLTPDFRSRKFSLEKSVEWAKENFAPSHRIFDFIENKLSHVS